MPNISSSSGSGSSGTTSRGSSVASSTTSSSTPAAMCSTSSSQGKLWMIQSFRYHSTVSWIIQDTVMVMMVVNDRKV